MTLDRRIAALERASPDDPIAILVDYVRPGDTQARLASATVGGANVQRLDDETEDDFRHRVHARALRTRGLPGIAIAFLRRGDRR